MMTDSQYDIFWKIEEIFNDDEDIQKVDETIHDYKVTVKINEWEFTKQMDEEELENFKREVL
jgi:hypothetical protein